MSSATSTRASWPSSTGGRTRPGSSPTTAASTRRRATASSATSSRPRTSSACAGTSASATPATRRSAGAAARTPSRSRSTRPFGIIMAHNGNVTNYKELKEELFEKYHRLLNSDCDVEVILNVFAQELGEQKTRGPPARSTSSRRSRASTRRSTGSYSVVAYIAEQGLVAFRDPLRHQAAGLRLAERRPHPVLRRRLGDASA